MRVCLSHSYSNEADQRDANDETKSDETKKLNLLDSFPVDDSVKVETLQTSTHQTAKSDLSLEKASSKIDLNKPPSL